jgi:hypothetical protein
MLTSRNLFPQKLAQRPDFKLGKRSILDRLDCSTSAVSSTIETPSQDVRAALVLSKETQSVPKRKDTTCMPPDRPPWAYWDYAPHAAGRRQSDWLNLQTH